MLKLAITPPYLWLHCTTRASEYNSSMIISPLSEEQARTKLQQILDWNRQRFTNYQNTNLVGEKGVGFVEHHITNMYNEFGGKWDERRATQYINSLAAENDLRNISIKIENTNP